MNMRGLAVVCVLACMGIRAADAQVPVGKAFAYQGRLDSSGMPASGTHDMLFRLFDSAAGGSQVGPTRCADNVPVTNGVFTVSLDFGSAFSGAALWLDIAVRADSTAGNCVTGTHTALSPRQRLTPAPYAAGLSLPMSLTQSTSGSLFSLMNNEPAAASSVARFTAGGAGGTGVEGIHAADFGTDPGVRGETRSNSGSAVGVFGLVSSTTPGSFSAGVLGENRGTGGFGVGVLGRHAGSGYGVYGTSVVDGVGVVGECSIVSGSSTAIWGINRSPTGVAGRFDGRVHVSGDITRRYGPAESRATPVAYATISSTGAVLASSGNVTVDYTPGSFQYMITIDGETYDRERYVTNVTAVGGLPVVPAIFSMAGNPRLFIILYDLSGTRVEDDFSVIVYKP